MKIALSSDVFSMMNREVEIKMKDNSILKGVLIGFFKDDEDADENHILKWHLVDKKDAKGFGIDAFGCLIGKIINQKDIEEIKLKSYF